jgi:CheY-like chemotaxis protein
MSIFPIDELFEQLKVEFEPLAKKAGLEFSVISSARFVRSDRRLLRRILQNLLSNGLKYTQKGGVVLGCRRRGRQILVQIHDTGPGIPPEQHAAIFKEFKRLDSNRRGVPGLGLGLSIVERMCAILDHPLSLTSKPGRGSTFAVSLPLAKWSEVRALPRSGGRATAYGDMRGCLVLCLDNDRTILEGMDALLAGWNCFVITAEGSADALPRLQAAQLVPDIVLTDYHLESETGLEALAKLHAAFGNELPGILITADRSLEIRALTRAHNLPLIYKPIKPASLRAVMSQMIVRQRAAE